MDSLLPFLLPVALVAIAAKGSGYLSARRDHPGEYRAAAERIIAATEQIVGDFSRPNSGLLFVAPVGRVLGLEKWRHE